jgi:hypothetical protein
VDSAGTTIWIRASGEYRVTVVDSRAVDPEVRLTVLRGMAELTSPFGRTLVRAGSESRTTARTEPSLPYVVTAASWDDFDRWVDAERDYRLGARSAQYLPAELRYYGGTFDRYGAWEYDRGYGYVWYPRVAVDWQPYYNGHWSFVGAFGWTWIGAGRWTWPTHHYGRWGYTTGRWFWIPNRHWAPAWVSWATAPGYVSWCPLGFDNRPVISITQITHFDSYRRGWTVVPARNFGHRVAVPRYANALRSAPLTAGARFASRADAPVRPAVIRTDAQPLRGPTAPARSVAVPRSTARSVETDVAPVRPVIGSRSAAPARTNDSATRSATAASLDQQQPGNSRVARPRVDDQERRDPSSSPRVGVPARMSDSVSRSSPAAPVETARPSNSRVAQPRVEERRDVQPDAWRVPNVQPRAPQMSRPAPASEPPVPSERPVYGRRAPQAQPDRPATGSPAREERASPPARSRTAEPAPRAVPMPSRPAPERAAPSRPSTSERPSSDRPSRVVQGRTAERAPSQGDAGSNNGRAQGRSR